jgi:hypothetical protein
LLELFKSTTPISCFIAYQKKKKVMMMMMMKRIFATKRPLSKGKIFIEDSGGHHNLEGPIPKWDSAYHKKSKSHL